MATPDTSAAPTNIGGFALNWQNGFEIDVSGTKDPAKAENAKWEKLAAGINNFTPSLNETATNDVYMDGEGFGSTDVTGKRLQIAFTGHRLEGNAAQDYIASHVLDIGDKLKTLGRWTQTDGATIVGQVTLSDIVTSGGAPGAKQTLSFNMAFNGKPVYTPKDVTPAGDGTETTPKA
ncbi:phage tail tube protein [Lacticaseibacillus songhuajiangensis]|jgi:uncharacterized protein with beta-barrel porin domain|uniref:phage tail tube protein n=1 Tax=Lacticaseibacillus songhuajiangensis TaxID=1296539 RepID=UPI000F795D9A|nr:capsid protein [Lacticaseibacillus songhuajiangensis]